MLKHNFFDRIKGKDVVGGRFPNHSCIMHTVARFTIPMTPLERGKGEIYRRFEVSKKGHAKKLIIFHALGDMDKHVKQRVEDGASTSYNTLDGEYSPNQVKGSHLVKNHRKLPLFEAMMGPIQKSALYLGAKMPKDRKRLGYCHQVAMTTIAPSNPPLMFQKKKKGMAKLKKIMMSWSKLRHLVHLRKEATST